MIGTKTVKSALNKANLNGQNAHLNKYNLFNDILITS
jgi:hypothetical protein